MTLEFLNKLIMEINNLNNNSLNYILLTVKMYNCTVL